jgi:hypothetical protein
MKMWLNSTRLDGVQTVTRVKQRDYEMLTNYLYHCFNHFCYQMREIRWVVHVTRLGTYKKNSYTILVTACKGKILLGRSRCKW